MVRETGGPAGANRREDRIQAGLGSSGLPSTSLAVVRNPFRVKGLASRVTARNPETDSAPAAERQITFMAARMGVTRLISSPPVILGMRKSQIMRSMVFE